MDSTKLVEDVRAQIATIADKATEAEQKSFSDLIKRAKGATYGAEIVTYTPGMSALIFIHANPHNRKWQVGKTSEYARRMSVGSGAMSTISCRVSTLQANWKTPSTASPPLPSVGTPGRRSPS